MLLSESVFAIIVRSLKTEAPAGLASYAVKASALAKVPLTGISAEAVTRSSSAPSGLFAVRIAIGVALPCARLSFVRA
ncbi:Uncharacterised protein [Chlamydia trachomatis]|nr:Uncharacterised protein [Chlamydia trachomatis]